MPTRVQVQGRLANAGGGLLASSVSLDVALYSSANATLAVWAETLTGVTLQQGVFSVVLGKKVALDAALFASGDLWMGLSVDGQAELPRTPLSSVTFALQAAVADTARDVECDACVDGEVLTPGTVSLDRLLSAGCLPGDLIAFDGADFDCGPGDGFLISKDTPFGGDVSGTADALNLKPGVVDAEALAAAVADALVPPGAVMAFAGDVPPKGWLACDGAVVPRAAYPRLFGAIGALYGAGDGTTTFALPDLRGRVALGAGAGPGLTARTLGVALGAETVALSAAQLPVHTHTGTTVDAGGHNHLATSSTDGDHTHTATCAVAGVHQHSATTGAAGDHGHSLTSGGDHTHTMSSAGAHTHDYTRPQQMSDVDRGGGSSSFSLDNIQTVATSSAGSHTHPIQSAGSHVHTVESAGSHDHPVSVDSAGAHQHDVSLASAGSHDHDITVQGAPAHAHTFTTDAAGQGAPVPLAPPAVALHYIVKY